MAAQSAIPRETKGTREMRLVQVIHFTNHLREMMASSEGFHGGGKAAFVERKRKRGKRRAEWWMLQVWAQCKKAS